MAFTRANLVLAFEVPTVVHETTAVDNGFGSTTNLTQRKRRFWCYSEAAVVTAFDDAGYFADAGSTSGDSTLNEGDVVICFGSAGAVGIGSVTDAAAGTITGISGAAFA